MTTYEHVAVLQDGDSSDGMAAKQFLFTSLSFDLQISAV